MKAIVKKLLPKSAFQKIKELYYGGDKYHCNICDFKLKQFAFTGWEVPVVVEQNMVGAGKRRAMCPRCYSSDRERMLTYYLENELNCKTLYRGKRILHIAPAKNLETMLRSIPEVEYLCGDLNPDHLKYPDDALQVDLTDLKFPEAHFSLVMANHVLEHVPDDIKALKEIFRTLEKGGRAILQIPYSTSLEKTIEDPNIKSESDKLKAYGHTDHVRLYALDFIEKLKAVGFVVDPIYLEKKLGADAVRAMGLHPLEAIFSAEKR